MKATRWRLVVAAGLAAVLSSGAGLVPVPASAAPAPSSAGSQAPAAAAWVVDASMLSGQHRVQLAEVRTASGDAASAWAVPVTLDGRQPIEVGADSKHPEASKAKLDWHDPTGSMTVQGVYGTANVTPTSTSARAGIAAGSGSSFALAGKLLTWDQQQQLTSWVAKLNDMVFDPLNKLLASLSPVLSLLGLTVPTLQKMTALAVINVGSADVVSASASTSFAPGSSTARAQASLSSVQLLDGFVTIDGVKASASSEDTDGTHSRSAEATIGQVRLAGVPVTIGQDGIELLGNNVLSRALIAPLLDRLLKTLSALGITLRFAETSAHGDLREATALELDVDTPLGTLALSIGHAEASAPPPPALASAGPTSKSPTHAQVAPAPANSANSPSSGVDAASDLGPSVLGAVPPAASTPATTSSPSASGGLAVSPAGETSIPGIPAWLGVTLPRDAAKALVTVFLLLLLGGLAAAMIPSLLFAFGNRRPPAPQPARRPLLDTPPLNREYAP